MPKAQSVSNKKGEVVFRRKLAEQFAGKKYVIPGEPTFEENKKIIRQRIRDYTKYFKELKKKGVLEGPYLELGAGVTQGAMFLENRHDLKGFTTDISAETLALAPTYQKVLRYKKLPLRIACDIYNLPFRTGSIPFVFTFQTLHHLPDPLSIFSEVKRVLTPGGYFYFGEEPVGQRFNLNLWRRDGWNLKWWEKILKYLIVLHFISRVGKSEVENNILEEAPQLPLWERALNAFETVETKINVFPFGPTYVATRANKRGWIKGPFIRLWLLYILGGGIAALCGTKGVKKKTTSSLLECLACPNCASKPPLYPKDRGFICKKCKTFYGKRNGVLMIFSKDQMETLYSN